MSTLAEVEILGFLEALILGIVEGITEFLPISSTGHMILVAHLLGLEQSDFLRLFEVFIQLGAILAVVLIYQERLKRDFNLWKKLIAAFIPTGIIGLLLHSKVEELFSPFVVSLMLIAWGAIFIIVELLNRKRKPKILSLSGVGYATAVLIGIFQSLAMVPGTSRSGATIVGGLLLGMERKVATEFSFLLAIPTMAAASGFELLKGAPSLTTQEVLVLAVGFSTAFISAYLAVKWLLRFIESHTFIPFGIYRIIVGILFMKLFL